MFLKSQKNQAKLIWMLFLYLTQYIQSKISMSNQY